MLNDAMHTQYRTAAATLGVPMAVLMIVAGLFAPQALLALLPALALVALVGPSLLLQAGVVLLRAPEVIARLFSEIAAARPVPPFPIVRHLEGAAALPSYCLSARLLPAPIDVRAGKRG